MFGFVAADRSQLTEEQLLRYRGCYCGLCRKIGHTYGTAQRLALNYDLTFLAMLLSSLYEPDEISGSDSCIAHPFSKHHHWASDATEYAAAMNMALAYYNAMDDWQDERKLLSYGQAAIFRKAAEKAAKTYPRQWQAIGQCMDTLGKLEADNIQDPDAAANAFGLLMAELFVWKEDRWKPILRKLGDALGRFIYLMDAIMDLPKDLKSGNYNPLSSGHTENPKDYYRPVLTILMGECTDAFEQLPLLQDIDILRNILYSGVWIRFLASKETQHDR